MPFLKEQYEFARAIANENVEDFHGEQAHTFTNPALHECISQVIQNTRIDWLRSEIEKLEVEMKEYVWDNGECSICGYDSIYNEGEEHRCEVFNDSLTSIITRYKEELLELEKGI